MNYSKTNQSELNTKHSQKRYSNIGLSVSPRINDKRLGSEGRNTTWIEKEKRLLLYTEPEEKR